jgi:hypothetical protein
MCSVCDTVWRDSYNDGPEDECPFCGEPFKVVRKIRLEKIKTKAKKRNEEKRLADLKLELAEIDHNIWALEGGTPLAASYTPQAGRHKEFNEIQAAHFNDLGLLKYFHKCRTSVVAKITEVENNMGQK